MKASAVRLSHRRATSETAALSRRFRQLGASMAGFRIDLGLVLRTLTAKKIAFVLTGAYGIAGWTGRPRATHDIDLLVRAGRSHTRAVKAIQELYPNLETKTFIGVTAFFVPGESLSVIDILVPQRPDQLATLETAQWVKDGTKRYRVPTLEAALANKYGAMLSLSRDPLKRLQDWIDFSSMVKHSFDSGREPIDLAHLAELGEKVWPSGGAQEIVAWVSEAQKPEVVDLKTMLERARHGLAEE